MASHPWKKRTASIPKNVQQVHTLSPWTRDRFDGSQKDIQEIYLKEQKEKSALPLGADRMDI